MHPLAQIIAVIWVCATIGAAFTKTAEPFWAAAFVTVLFGIGYFLLRF